MHGAQHAAGRQIPWGDAAPTGDDNLPDVLELPCGESRHWEAIKGLGDPPIMSFDNLSERIARN